MVDQLRSFGSEVTRVAREVGTEGKLGGQADVRDLVDVARLTTGKITMTRAPVNLGDSARRCLKTLAGPGKNPEHLVELQGRDTWVLADSVRLDQILTNLVANARKFTPAGGRIHVRVEPEGDHGVFEIEDSGAGMAPDVLAHAFDLFFQGDRSPDRAGGGLGIGLTLMRQLVELHGGSIQASSAGEGQGSRFTIRLPCCAAPGGDDPVGVGAESAKPRRIVIVEDNEDARVMLKALLELAGHEVHDAADGGSGIALVEAMEPDVAFIDIGLPGIDGYEVARRLREGHKEVCLVALSGYGQSEDRRKAVEAGFDIHLLKPVDPERLSTIIGSLPSRRLGELTSARRAPGLA
jgi:two-component system, sensor histidine kinase